MGEGTQAVRAADTSSAFSVAPRAGVTLGKPEKNVKVRTSVEKRPGPSYGRRVSASIPAGRFWPLLTLFVPSLFGCAGDVPSTPSSDGVRRALSEIARRDEIEIVTLDPRFLIATTYGKIAGRPAAGDEIDRYSVLFLREFSLYPPSLIKRCGLKRIVLCKELAFDGQLRGAIPDFEHDTLYLDVLRGGSDPLYLCKVLHHEFFHIIDYRDDGHVYEDQEWAALNPPGFKYGTGGKNAQHVASARELTDKFPGFLNYYSTTGVEEDKAEVFANLIVDPAYVAQRTKDDRVLGAKVQALKKLLVKFCPEVNTAFWSKAAAVKR